MLSRTILFSLGTSLLLAATGARAGFVTPSYNCDLTVAEDFQVPSDIDATVKYTGAQKPEAEWVKKNCSVHGNKLSCRNLVKIENAFRLTTDKCAMDPFPGNPEVDYCFAPVFAKGTDTPDMMRGVKIPSVNWAYRISDAYDEKQSYIEAQILAKITRPGKADFSGFQAVGIYMSHNQLAGLARNPLKAARSTSAAETSWNLHVEIPAVITYWNRTSILDIESQIQDLSVEGSHISFSLACRKL